MENLSYGEAITELQKMAGVIYDQAGGLRDSANSEEKKYWNQARGQASELERTFRELYNSISKGKSSMELSFSMEKWIAWVKKQMRWS